MSNYYTLFSGAIGNITLEERRWIERKIQELTTTEAEKNRELFLGSSAGVEDIGFLWEFGEDSIDHSTYFLIYADESGDLEVVAKFVQEFLATWSPDKEFRMSWANIADTPVSGGFGGGAFVVTATETRWFNTEQWLMMQDGYNSEGNKNDRIESTIRQAITYIESEAWRDATNYLDLVNRVYLNPHHLARETLVALNQALINLGQSPSNSFLVASHLLNPDAQTSGNGQSSVNNSATSWLNLSEDIRPVTVNLISNLLLDQPLSPAQITDFGVKSPSHYTALREVLESLPLETAARLLDEALQDGEKLNTLVREHAPYYTDVVFTVEKI